MGAPDLIKPLLGWRTWVADGTQLLSPHLQTPWAKGVIHAQCEPYPQTGEVWDSAPAVIPNMMGETCRCGEVHEFLSTPTDAGCLARAYPLSYAQTYSLVEPVTADDDFVPYEQWHHAPEESCECGWYGLHRRPERLPRDSSVVVGTIAGWGKTVMTADGFRCASAMVIGVVGNQAIADAYGAHYADGVDELAAMITEAAPAPASMYPETSDTDKS